MTKVDSGLAADIKLETQSEESMLITDVIENLGMVFKNLCELCATLCIFAVKRNSPNDQHSIHSKPSKHFSKKH